MYGAFVLIRWYMFCIFVCSEQTYKVLLARDSMLSALYAIANPSVCPSVRHTGGSVENGLS